MRFLKTLLIVMIVVMLVLLVLLLAQPKIFATLVIDASEFLAMLAILAVMSFVGFCFAAGLLIAPFILIVSILGIGKTSHSSHQSYRRDTSWASKIEQERKEKMYRDIEAQGERRRAEQERFQKSYTDDFYGRT